MAAFGGQDRYSPYAAMGNQPESAVDPNGLAPQESGGLALERARVDGSDPQDNPFARAQKIAMDPGAGSAFAGPGASDNAISMKITGADAIAKVMQMLGGGSSIGQIIKGVEDVAQDGNGDSNGVSTDGSNEGDGNIFQYNFPSGYTPQYKLPILNVSSGQILEN